MMRRPTEEELKLEKIFEPWLEVSPVPGETMRIKEEAPEEAKQVYFKACKIYNDLALS